MRIYGAEWPEGIDPLQIELACISKGGRWQDADGFTCGRGLFNHYQAAWRLMWPEDDEHRWSDLGLRRMCEHEINVFMGPGDSNKTYLISKFVLTHWWASPFNRLWLCSSTDRRGAELRIWGKIKEFFNRARAKWPWLQGRVLESKGCITPDEISEDQSEARLLTRGIIFIPCKQGNTWLGLGPYAGIKPPVNGFLGHAGDEVSLMAPSFLDAYSNWYGKKNFKGLLTGNPGDLEDPLCTAGEPEGGWESWRDNGKTQEWRSRFFNAWVVAYDGRDSPNNDQPYVNGEPRFHYLIGKKKMEAVLQQYGANDWHYWNQCVGKPSLANQSRRVITRALCESKNAFDDVTWLSTDGLTNVVSCDAAYGGVGGDRCVIRLGKFGRDINRNMVILSYPPEIVPVSVNNPEPPEDQIAAFCKSYCVSHNVPPEHFFFDGRSTLAVTMARSWSPMVNCVDFGGKPTTREVTTDEFMWEGDTMSKRLVKADERYFNFVTELWFSIYYLIHSRQLRGLDRETAKEGYQRAWDMKGNRIQVEPKKDMKERTNQSPDLFDALVTMVEGCRRLGFVISMLPKPGTQGKNGPDFLQMELDKYRNFIRASELTYS